MAPKPKHSTHGGRASTGAATAGRQSSTSGVAQRGAAGSKARSTSGGGTREARARSSSGGDTAAQPRTPPPAPLTPGDLGSVVQFRGASWRVVYAGPVLHRDGHHVGLELVPPGRLAATFMPASSPPQEPASTNAGESSRGAEAEQIARALLRSIQRQYEDVGGRTDRSIELCAAESESLALAECMRENAQERRWTNGTGPDGTRYFTPSSASTWAIIVPWSDVIADAAAYQARTALRVDVLQSLVPAELDVTPQRQRASAGSTPGRAASEDEPAASSSPVVVGSTASLIRRSQHRSSAGDAAQSSSSNQRFVDAKAPVAAVRGAQRNSGTTRAASADGGGGLSGWGSISDVSDADDDAVMPSASADAQHALFDHYGGHDAVAHTSSSPAARRAHDAASGDDASPAASPASSYQRGGRAHSAEKLPTTSTGTQTLTDTWFGWIKSATVAPDASLHSPTAIRGSPNLSAATIGGSSSFVEPELIPDKAAEDVNARAQALARFTGAIREAMGDLRHSLAGGLADGLLRTLHHRWVDDIGAIEAIAMQPPTQHPPLPGALLVDSGAHDDSGRDGDADLSGPPTVLDDPILIEAVDAEEARDVDAAFAALSKSTSSTTGFAAAERAEVELAEAETDILGELCSRTAADTAGSEGKDLGQSRSTPRDAGGDEEEEGEATVCDPSQSGHFAALRRIARSLAQARASARRCVAWIPRAQTDMDGSPHSSPTGALGSSVMQGLKPLSSEVTELTELYAAVETTVAVALRPLLSFLARRPVEEPLLASAIEEDDLSREAIARLRFDAQSHADAAGAAEADGDVQLYEERALERLASLEQAQEFVGKLCSSLYPPITSSLVEDPKATLRIVAERTRKALANVRDVLETGIRAARQSRCDALAQLDGYTSTFIRTSYQIARDVAEDKRQLASITDQQRDVVASIVELVKRLDELATSRESVSSAMAQRLARRARLLGDYEVEKQLSARRICHAHREVLALRCLRTAVGDGDRDCSSMHEAEVARIMAMQRTVAERSLALHELHHSVHRDVTLAAGELAFRKSALHKRIVDRSDTVKVQLFIAQESSTDDEETRTLAAKRDELDALGNAIVSTVGELEGIMHRSRDEFENVSGPPLITAGRELVDPHTELLAINEGRQAKLLTYETDVLRVRDPAAPAQHDDAVRVAPDGADEGGHAGSGTPDRDADEDASAID